MSLPTAPACLSPAFAVIYIPQFALQAVLRHEPELWSKPVALVDPATRTPLVCEMTEAAQAAGINKGLTPTQALARCSQVLIRTRSPRQESAASNAMLQCAYAFSPNLEATALGICTLDLRGLAALPQGEREALEQWAQKIQHALAKVSLTASIGMGATPNIARQAACWGRGLEIVEAPGAFMPGLPLRALEPSPEVALLLHRWGIRTVGELLALGQEAVTARLGMEALALFAAACTSSVRPLRLAHPTERFEETFEFDPEIETLEPLLFLLRRFVDCFQQRLEPRGLVVESLLLQLGLESGQKVVSRLRIPQPTRQADILFRALSTHLESVRTESPVKNVSLAAQPTREEQKQLGLFETILSDPHQFQETLARLSAILGADRVGTPALENSHRPDAFQLIAPDFENAPVPVESPGALLSYALPLRRFRPAIPAEVECASGLENDPVLPGKGSGAEEDDRGTQAPDANTVHSVSRGTGMAAGARPVSIRCSVARGKLRILIGPWRASGHWWEPGGWEREEWDAATADGQVIRLVHQTDGWFVEGVVD